MKSVRISSSEEVLIRLFNKLVKHTKKLVNASNAYQFDRLDERWGKIETFQGEFHKAKPDVTLIDFSQLSNNSIYKKIYDDFNQQLRRQIEFTNDENSNRAAHDHLDVAHPGDIEKILEEAEFISKNVVAQWVYFEQVLDEFQQDHKQLFNIEKKRINLGVDVATFNTDAEKLAKGDIITKSNFLGQNAIDNDKLREKGFDGGLFLLCRLIAYPNNPIYLEEFIQKREKDIANNNPDPLLEMGIHSIEELKDLLQKLDKIGTLVKRSEQKIRIGEIEGKLVGLKLDRITANENLLSTAKKELRESEMAAANIQTDEKSFLKRKPTHRQLKSVSNKESIKDVNKNRPHKIAVPLGHSRQSIVSNRQLSTRQSSLFSPTNKEREVVTERKPVPKATEKEKVESNEKKLDNNKLSKG